MAVALFPSTAQSRFLKDGDPHSPRALKTRKPQEDKNKRRTSSGPPLWRVLFRTKKVIFVKAHLSVCHLAGGN